MLAFEKRWAGAILVAFAPVGESPFGPEDAPYLQTLERMISASNWRARAGLRLGLWLVTFAPLWLLGRLRLLPSLPLLERTALLDRLLSHSNFEARELTLLLKIAASLTVMGLPALRARSGYGPAGAQQLPAAANEEPAVRLPLVAGQR